MNDFFGNIYEIGDKVYYVTIPWDRHLQARLGEVVAVNAKTITVKNTGGLLSVLRKPQRHINVSKMQSV